MDELLWLLAGLVKAWVEYLASHTWSDLCTKMSNDDMMNTA